MSGETGSGPKFHHGSALALGGRGVLIRGASGSGKSSLLLSLLRRGTAEGLHARLVADDQVIVMHAGGELRLRAPDATAGLLEVRGVGILRMPFEPSAPLDLVVDLAERDTLQRLPDENQNTARLLGLAAPRIRLPARDPAFGADVVLTLLGCGTRRIAVD